MKISISSKDNFVDSFIYNLSRISDTGVLEILDNKISCKTKTGDDTIIIYSEYVNDGVLSDQKLTLNIPDFKKLYKLLSVAGQLELDITTNTIAYKSDGIRFKFHLYDDGVLTSPAINIEKLKKVPFDGTFSIASSELNNLVKGSCLLMDIPKFYLQFTDNIVMGEIADKARDNVDSFACQLSIDYVGQQMTTAVPLNIEFLKILASTKASRYEVRYASTLNVFAFDIKNHPVNTTYIVTALQN